MSDTAARMRDLIDQHTGSGPYVPRVAATEIVEKLRENDPDLLSDWLDEQATHFVWQAINDRDRSRRSRAVHTNRSSAFREAAVSHTAGDVTALRAFLDAPYTVADGSRRRLAELRRDDLLHVAGAYDKRAHENGMWSAFMKALAKKVSRGTVSDHFTEPQLAAMWNSLAA
ncbi:hypothetical protein [Pseudonocardia sp.]|uniref:hypothetical protein n=1 Tax=Pseudonocardia sp. TaxID=60912 RepID=UPI003D0B30AB